jgi:hypothetical protein
MSKIVNAENYKIGPLPEFVKELEGRGGGGGGGSGRKLVLFVN